jgi:glycosyltransferase involved in cell wall biosynthesis
MVKLVINIPCLNEEKTLPLVLKELPKKIKGVSSIIVQVVDDGSTDKTLEVAKKHGCKVIIHKYNKGLGISFKDGMESALKQGADIFVNTDADNQYPSRYIPNLVKPILEGKADLVIGDRRPWKVKHFSPLKRLLQLIGNKTMSSIIGVPLTDTVSGFRAYSREAMLRINVVTRFSYVLDTIMQANHKGLKILSFPIKTNPATRDSRLFKNIFEHMIKSTVNMTRLFYLYEPFKVFTYISMIFFIPGLFLFLRFFYFYLTGNSGGHIQSLVISAILLITTALMFGFGIINDSLKINRMLIEDQYYLKKKEMFGKSK